MKCKKCGYEFKGRFCPKCGTSAKNGVYQQTEKKMEIENSEQIRTENLSDAKKTTERKVLTKLAKFRFWCVCVCAIIVGIGLLVVGFRGAGIFILLSAIFFCPKIIEKFRLFIIPIFIACFLAVIGAGIYKGEYVDRIVDIPVGEYDRNNIGGGDEYATDLSEKDNDEAVSDTTNENKVISIPENKSVDADTQENENTIETDAKMDISDIESIALIREKAPYAYLYVAKMENGNVGFTGGIGVSGAPAYRDIREYEAVWLTNDTVEWKYEDHVIDLKFNGDGTITLNEVSPYDELSMNGTYKRFESSDDVWHYEFIFPDSDQSLLTVADCQGMNAIECKIARNEIYARHNRKFDDQELEYYFESCDWYSGSIEPVDFKEDMLNEIEKENLQTISEYEKQAGYK